MDASCTATTGITRKETGYYLHKVQTTDSQQIVHPEQVSSRAVIPGTTM